MNHGNLQPHRYVDEREAINVRGVIAIRWVAVLGQFLTILVVHHVLDVRLPLTPLLTVLLGTALVNVALLTFYRAQLPLPPDRGQVKWHAVLGFIMLFDLLALTMLLYFTGGIYNPFSLFYFVNLVLSAILLPKVWVYILGVIAIVCLVVLSVAFQPLAILEQHDQLSKDVFNSIDIRKLGVLVAFITCVLVTVFFASHMSGQLRSHERRMREFADLRARSERVQALGTLAAGAAHELGSPLSTIAVISEEMERELESGRVTAATLRGMQSIRSELTRCRQILDRMSTDAGLAVGESISETTVGAVVREAIEGLGPNPCIKTTFVGTSKHARLKAPLHGLAQAIRAVLKNAVDAEQGRRQAECQVTVSSESCLLTVQDQGAGMDTETLRRVGEPFFTTKEPQNGTGLGVFLARNVIEGLAGKLEISSSPGKGTSVLIELPLSPGRERSNDGSSG